MDVRQYFEDVDFTYFSELNHAAWKYTMGAAIEKNAKQLIRGKYLKLDLVIFGAPFDSRKPEYYSTKTPDKIRKELYYLAKPENKLNIVDFGNLKASTSIKGNYKALRDIVEYFNELNVQIIIIGGSQDLNYGVCEAFKSNKLFTYSTIDSFLDVKTSKESFNSGNYLSRIFASNPNLFQFNLIGYQSHYFASEYFTKIKGIGNHIRLGQLRENIVSAEPIIRNADVLSFDIGAIKYSEAPGGNCPNPNGLRSEEACQLSKYAGISERLKVFGLFNVDHEKDQFNLTIQLSSQIIWYFIEGFSNRNKLKASFEENKTIYQVDVKEVNKPIVFLKNQLTGQWWMQLQAINNKKIVLSCSENEYRQACNNDIPDLWLRYIQKIDELLK
jgi:arginase family enzyme